MPSCIPFSYSQCNLGVVIKEWFIYLSFNIFEPVNDQEQRASTYKRRNVVCSEVPVITNEPKSLNDLPDEILLHILSYFRPDDLCFIAKVSKRLNVLAKDALRKTHSYGCYGSSNISHIKKVRCTALLGFMANKLTKFSPS